jgi:transcriptional regulator with XRE-family HTH domain
MNICRLRTGRVWTQKQLAEAADVDLTTVQRNEAGRVLPDGCDMLKLAVALKVDVNDLYHGLPRKVGELSRLHPRRRRV